MERGSCANVNLEAVLQVQVHLSSLATSSMTPRLSIRPSHLSCLAPHLRRVTLHFNTILKFSISSTSLVLWRGPNAMSHFIQHVSGQPHCLRASSVPCGSTQVPAPRLYSTCYIAHAVTIYSDVREASLRRASVQIPEHRSAARASARKAPMSSIISRRARRVLEAHLRTQCPDPANSRPPQRNNRARA